ncbi:MAG: hypothetical protein L6R41_003192 [Letrouitia leprolyta]|nr:MAG: hypothetical protein L6R41_003192 [Letrouitia leprolyta]
MAAFPSRLHLEILNLSYHPADEGTKFTLFSRLPKELRLAIWRRTLQHHRIVKIKLAGLRGWTGTEQPCHAQNEQEQAAAMASIGREERYRVIFKGSQILSKLLRVNRESRQEALTFYRVHIPCQFKRSGMKEDAGTFGTLYFNPEYDFLRIIPYMPVKDTLVDFLYHLKTAYDARGIGLLNLALEENDLTANDLYSLNLSDLEPKFKNTFLETFTQLREVFFVEAPRFGRQVTGYQSGLLTGETWFNRSFPILAAVPAFDRLPRDPRPIHEDLTRVIVSGGSDPRYTFDRWLDNLAKWGVSPQGVQYRFLTAFDTTNLGGVSTDLTSARKYLQGEDDRWNGREPWQSDTRIRIGAKHEDWKDEDLTKAVQPAFGFWLFPIEALGAIRASANQNGENTPSRDSRVKDMTGYWPELALSRLY